MNPGVTMAIKNVGGPTNLARLCGVSIQAVRKWQLERITAERAVEVARIADVPLHLFRPDIWSKTCNVNDLH